MVETMLRGSDQLANVTFEKEPLPKLARGCKTEEIRKLIKKGHYTHHDLDSALANAIWYGEESEWPQREELADLLLDHGADPDGQYGSDYGPIMFGCGEGLQTRSLKYLMDAGADLSFPRIKTKYGETCVLDTIAGTYVRGRNEAKRAMIRTVQQAGAHIPPDVTPELLAIHTGDVSELQTLLKKDPSKLNQQYPEMPYGNLSLKGATLLHCAVEFGELEIVKLLIEMGADLNTPSLMIEGVGGQTPVFHAVNTWMDFQFHLLEYFVQNHSSKLDLSIKARLSKFQETMKSEMDLFEYAELGYSEEERKCRKKVDEEKALLKQLRAS